jgi:type I restriction enzyme, R subunit
MDIGWLTANASQNRSRRFSAHNRGRPRFIRASTNPLRRGGYPAAINTGPKQALFDNLDKNENLAVAIDAEIRVVKKDNWRGNKIKEKEVRNAIRTHLADPALVDSIFELVRNQREY